MSTTTPSTTTVLRPAIQTTVAPPIIAAGQRLASLDIFRGATIAGMMLVNNAGDWDHIYWPLEHAEWNGWTPTDLIFPFFLFIVGVSMVLSFASRRAKGQGRGPLLLHSVKRSAIIFGLGLFLAAYPHFDPHTTRIPGVLQRIAVVYLITAVLVLYTGRITRIITAAALLIGYWLLVTRVPVPGCGVGVLTMDCALPGYIDRSLIYNHMWIAHRWDPEGLLSTLPAIATCLLGVFTGEWLRSLRSQGRKLAGMLVAGAVGLAAGKIWGVWFPINKNMWSSSFVLFTAGFALVVLGVCYWLVDIRGWRSWGKPFAVLGMNAIAVYVLGSFVAHVTVQHHIGGATIKDLLYGSHFAHMFANPYNASMSWGLLYVLGSFLVAWAMYRKKVFIKV